MAQNNFQRVEQKYLLSQEKYEKLYPEILKHMKVDRYGLSAICNIYYDTDDFRLIRESIQKPVYKEKLRLRTYGVPQDESSLSYVEIKKKCEGTVYKRRVALPYGEAFGWLEGGRQPEQTQIGNEIGFMLKRYGKLQPAVVLCYDRVALYGIEDKEVRLTFDNNIRFRTEDFNLTRGDSGEMLFDENLYMMEIKLPDKMPEYMKELFTKYEIYPTSFSKYGAVYTQKILAKKV